ncbi:MAG: O-antigen ligase family protein [Salinibacterium sp.]|nr:O-antigen ligase family protein [Salinibacterium sp.]
MRLIENRRARTGFLVLMLFTLLAGDAWRYTIGWIGWGILVGLMTVASVALLIAQRDRWRLNSLPYPLLAFLVLAALSVAWSFYPGASALGAASTWFTVAGAVAVAVTYTWGEILSGLGIALRFALGLSVLFELVVAVIIRRPVLPPIAQPGIDYSHLPDPIPVMLYWSRDELFGDGKIQGILGNSVLLSFVALLGIIVFGIQLFDKHYRKRWSIVWLAVAVACFVLTRSATNIVGLAVVLAVAAAVLLVRRAATSRSRGITYAGLAAIGFGAVVGAIVFLPQILRLLGKSSDFTNRGEIWTSVIALAQERPVFGWGWVSYWAPWAPPFDTLASNNGVRQLHAHDAWLDIWLQLGIIGLMVMGALVLSTLVRSWVYAIDRPQSAPGLLGGFTAATLLPLLVLVALLVQSVAESKLLVEYGMFLLALLAFKTKLSAREELADL